MEIYPSVIFFTAPYVIMGLITLLYSDRAILAPRIQFLLHNFVHIPAKGSSDLVGSFPDVCVSCKSSIEVYVFCVLDVWDHFVS